MKKYNVYANQMCYFLATEIEAENKEEAKEKYLQMLDEGEIEINQTDIIKVEATKIINS